MRMINDNNGFTLIEMLVAASVSAIILVMVYTAYSSIIKSVNYGHTASSYYESLNFAVRRIDTDISNLYWKNDTKNLNIICIVQGGSGILNFITTAHRESKMIYNLKDQVPLSDVHEVGFYLKKKPDTNSFDLIRRSSIGYDDTPEEGGSEEVLLQNVISLNFEFQNGNDWVPTWDSRENKKIPLIIKTSISVLNSAKESEQYHFLSIPNLVNN